MDNMLCHATTLPGCFGGSSKIFTIKNMRSPGHPFQSLDVLYYNHPIKAGALHLALGCNLAERQQMLRTASDLKGNTNALIISPVIGGDFLTDHMRHGRKPVMHLPQCWCLATSHAVSKKKHHKASQTDDSAEGDVVSEKQPMLDKPPGFGQGKVYDTSLEERLLEEIERDKNAQTAALLKKRKSMEANIIMKKTKDKTESQSPPTGVEVWVGDLPKKKKVERDLQSAFKTVPGLLHIRPSVLGNKKTRDPICKGFAFLTFKSLNFAESFISRFKQESICFGNIEKQLLYKILVDDASASNVELSRVNCTTVPKLRVRDKSAVLNANIASVPVLGVPASSLQPELISSSTSDAEDFEDDMEKSDSSLEIWSDLEDEDDAAVDIELTQNTETVFTVVETCAETAETGKAHDNELRDLKHGSDRKVQQSSFKDVFSSEEAHCQSVPTEPDRFLTQESVDSSRESSWEDGIVVSNGNVFNESEDLDSNSMIQDYGFLQENNAKTIPVDEVKEKDPDFQHLTEDEKRIKALEERVLKKYQDLFGSKETDSSQQKKKVTGFKPNKSKPSKQKPGNNLGSASRLKKREREFLTGALEKYGKRTSTTDS